jgi:hypothetical protein
MFSARFALKVTSIIILLLPSLIIFANMIIGRKLLPSYPIFL